MSRKDYRALAAGLRELVEETHTEGEREVAISAVNIVAQVCFDDNRRFDWVKFKGACGL